MINELISTVTGLIVQAISTSGYWGIFILMALESALIPIPSEVTMPFSGYLASVGRFNFWMVSLVGATANLVGSIAAYLLGFWGQKVLVEKVIGKYGQYLLITKHEFYQAETWFRKHGEKIVFFSRVLPVVRTFISLPAGIAQMNFVKFCYLTLIGSFIWSVFLTYIGLVLGKNWSHLEVYYRKFELLIFAVFMGAVLYYILHRVKKITKK